MSEQETPQFDPPLTDADYVAAYDMRFLGRFEAEGTQFDLWYTLYLDPIQTYVVAGIYAIHGNAADFGDRPDQRLLHERARFYRKHGIYDKLPQWRPGANLALEEADRRVEHLQLQLTRYPTSKPEPSDS